MSSTNFFTTLQISTKEKLLWRLEAFTLTEMSCELHDHMKIKVTLNDATMVIEEHNEKYFVN